MHKRETAGDREILAGTTGALPAQNHQKVLGSLMTRRVGTASRSIDAPNLDEARERELLLRVRSNPPGVDSGAALNELWMSHGKLVAAIAAKYRRSDVDHDDLINAGHLGLHTAITRFDTERFDTRLAAYATGWIRWHITDYIRRNSGPCVCRS